MITTTIEWHRTSEEGPPKLNGVYLVACVDMFEPTESLLVEEVEHLDGVIKGTDTKAVMEISDIIYWADLPTVPNPLVEHPA